MPFFGFAYLIDLSLDGQRWKSEGNEYVVVCARPSVPPRLLQLNPLLL